MILAGLGFVMSSTYKHKQAVKEIVAPWLVERLLEIAADYLKPTMPVPPTEEPVEPVDVPEITKEVQKARLIAQLAELGEEVE